MTDEDMDDLLGGDIFCMCAKWDNDAEVWFTCDTFIGGMGVSVEAATLSELRHKVMAMASEAFKLDTSAEHGPMWGVDFHMEPDREIGVDVQAPTSKEALMKAVSALKLEEGELFHSIHVSAPYPKPKVELNELPDGYASRTVRLSDGILTVSFKDSSLDKLIKLASENGMDVKIILIENSDEEESENDERSAGSHPRDDEVAS